MKNFFKTDLVVMKLFIIILCLILIILMGNHVIPKMMEV